MSPTPTNCVAARRHQCKGLERAARSLLAVAAFAVSACDGPQAALNPAGPQAERIAWLSWFMIISLSIVYVIVIGILIAGFIKRSRAGVSGGPVPVSERLEMNAAGEARLTRWVVIGVLITAGYLVLLMVLDVSTGRALSSMSEDEDPLIVDVIGHQWWWEIVYPAQDPSRTVTTANELHIPVGRTVRIRTSSVDVIHSLWIPRLHGKRDLIPDHPSAFHLRADQPGVFRGQCAEFCGLQHARMSLLVIAQPEAEFRAWQAAQLLPAQVPADSIRRLGMETFLTDTCTMCHAIAGTPASARAGPDLTHFGSRRTIGAATLPNNRGNLGGWIIDPHHIKPGVNMPANPIPADRLNALISYLEGLK